MVPYYVITVSLTFYACRAIRTVEEHLVFSTQLIDPGHCNKSYLISSLPLNEKDMQTIAALHKEKYK